jgi:hypothetical protein
MGPHPDDVAASPSMGPHPDDVAGALVITTRIRSLVAGATEVHCEILSPHEALALLLTEGGVPHLLPNPPTAATLAVELCGRLPLALGIAGGIISELSDGCDTAAPGPPRHRPHRDTATPRHRDTGPTATPRHRDTAAPGPPRHRDTGPTATPRHRVTESTTVRDGDVAACAFVPMYLSCLCLRA